MTKSTLREYVVVIVEKYSDILVGLVTIDLKDVDEVIDKTHDIKHNMPSKFAKREARRKYPQCRGKAVIVFPTQSYLERYPENTDRIEQLRNE